jgi:hypothetical protein
MLSLRYPRCVRFYPVFGGPEKSPSGMTPTIVNGAPPFASPEVHGAIAP